MNIHKLFDALSLFWEPEKTWTIIDQYGPFVHLSSSESLWSDYGDLQVTHVEDVVWDLRFEVFVHYGEDSLV